MIYFFFRIRLFYIFIINTLDSTFGLNAVGLRSTIYFITTSLSLLWSSLLWHEQQLQSFPQTTPAAKQSQYNFRHFDFLQLHTIVFGFYSVCIFLRFEFVRLRGYSLANFKGFLSVIKFRYLCLMALSECLRKGDLQGGL